MPILNISNLARNDKTFYSLTLQTRAKPCFTNIYNQFYFNGTKIIPLDIYDYLDEIALAIWIEGDGNFKVGGGLMLCTDSYTIQEVVLLMNVLLISYNIKSSLVIVSGKYRIYINYKESTKVNNIVNNNIHFSMLYKILGNYPIN